MATLTPVAANITLKSNHTPKQGVGASALAAGEVVFLNGSSQWEKVSAITSGSMEGKTVGVVITPCDAVGEYFIYVSAEGAVLDLGVTVDDQKWYVAAGVAGDIEEPTDLSAGEDITWLGYGNGDGNFVLNVNSVSATV